MQIVTRASWEYPLPHGCTIECSSKGTLESYCSLSVCVCVCICLSVPNLALAYDVRATK